MKNIIIVFAALFFPAFSIAQSESDALKYSYKQLNGTPRVLGMGGAGSVMGADLYSLVSNPAGLAQSRNSQYLFSLGLTSTNNKSFYINQEQSADAYNLSLPALGASFTTIKMDRGREVKKGLVSYTLALSVQRTANFNRKMSFNGINSSSSILDHFANMAYGYSTSELNSSTDGIPELAWQNYLIDSDQNGGYYAALPDTITMQQYNTSEESGRGNNFNFGFGLNFSHIVYIGATISLNTIRYENNTNWRERSLSVFNPEKSMSYDYGYTSIGTGAKISLGMIVRPNDNIRIGASYHSGTRYNMFDEYYYKMSSTNFPTNGSYYSGNSNLLNFSYTLKTPERIEAGIAVLIKKIAVINLDLDFINYGNSRLSSDFYTFSTENNSITNSFRNTKNLRLGAEILQGPMRYRTGFAISQSPLKASLLTTKSNYTFSQKSFTLGLGYKAASGFFADFAFLRTWYNDYYTPYQLNSDFRTSYTAINEVKSNRFVIGIGSYF